MALVERVLFADIQVKMRYHVFLLMAIAAYTVTQSESTSGVHYTKAECGPGKVAGNVSRRVENLSKLRCARLCASNSSCKAFNFNPGERVCELTEHTGRVSCDLHVVKEGYSLYYKQRNTTLSYKVRFSTYSPPGAREKVASDLGLGGVFCRALLQLQLASHDLAAIWQKSVEKRNSKFNLFTTRVVTWADENR